MIVNMSMRKKTVALVIACILIGGAVGYGVAYYGRLQSQIQESTEETGYRLAVDELLKDVLWKVKEVRGLSPPEEVELKIVTVDWVRENWGRGYVEAHSDEIEMEEKTYKALFLTPGNLSLREVFVDWTEGYIIAVAGNEVYVVKENFSPFDGAAKRTVAHEVTHLIQSHHFETPERDTYDGKNAWSALVEGDADLTAKKYMERFEEAPPNPQLDVDVLECHASPVYRMEASRSELPKSVLKLLYFPYDYGEDFVRALLAEGGWEAVNEAYNDPPTTTEQVMHPEKYVSLETANRVESPPLDVSGWQKKKSDRLGEHFILVMLDTWILEEEAERAASGWGGDNFTYYEKDDKFFFTWKTLWDSEEDASEFYSSFLQMIDQVGAEEAKPSLWRVYGEYISVDRDKSTILIRGSSDEAMITN